MQKFVFNNPQPVADAKESTDQIPFGSIIPYLMILAGLKWLAVGCEFKNTPIYNPIF